MLSFEGKFNQIKLFYYEKNFIFFIYNGSLMCY